MDSTNIELPGSTVSAVSVDGDTIRIRFEPAYLIKTMTGSVERTRWRQNGSLLFEGAELDQNQPLPKLPANCTGGDVGENIYTYRRCTCVARLSERLRRKISNRLRLTPS